MALSALASSLAQPLALSSGACYHASKLIGSSASMLFGGSHRPMSCQPCPAEARQATSTQDLPAELLRPTAEVIPEAWGQVHSTESFSAGAVLQGGLFGAQRRPSPLPPARSCMRSRMCYHGCLHTRCPLCPRLRMPLPFSVL